MSAALLSPIVDYYNDEEELDSVDDEDERSIRGRDSDEDTEDASETDIANKQDDEDYLEVKEQMYQEKLTSLKRQLQQLQEGTLQEYQKRMKKLDQQYKERIRNAASPSSPEHLPSTPAESPAQRYEARIEDGKLYYDKRWYHKSQAIYLESKENTKIGCVISSVGTNEIWVRKTSDSTKMRIYLGQLHRGVFIIRRRSAA
ncbi:sin3 histone deacetylase corepressor complex component SDS3 isoform X2 [Mobula hypostoma]|uniref:sin3 histone deacetylase corepressor complex component SDS3 isoform X2 n=1 Tax=Mobula hypostoma TaxID=723540 RepID=UPI002FC34961